MKFERVAAAAIAVGVLGMAAILVFGPRTDVRSPARAVSFAQPITPSGYPYSSLAIMRQARTVDDVLPSYVGKYADRYVPSSVHHIASSGEDDIWLAVQGSGDLCLLLTSQSDEGANSACTPSPTRTVARGSTLISAGFGDHLKFEIISDGVPSKGTVDEGYRQIAPNVWHKGRGRVITHPGVSGDPYAFPRVEPYKSFAILRRERTAEDAAPKSLTDDISDFYSTLRFDQVRYAGDFHGAKIWVTVDTKGQACLIAENEVGSFSCLPNGEIENTDRFPSFGVQDVFVRLIADGKRSGDDTEGLTKIAPNVWAGTLSD